METDINEETLTDGSTGYSVVFFDGSYKVQIDCVSEQDARALQHALTVNAEYAIVSGS